MSARGTGAIEAVERIVNREEEADAILRGTVAVLAERLGTGVLLRFHDEGRWIAGPSAGDPPGGAGTIVPVVYDGETIAEFVLADDPGEDRAAVETVAGLLAVFCLVGWDTDGEEWVP